MASTKHSAYTAAGVDIDAKAAAIAAVKGMIRKTHVPGVLSGIGLFGGLFRAPGRDQALIASTDGVGTKLKVAVMAGRHDTIGQDIVNHCVNDILVHGAAPLFFLDYLGSSRFEPNVFRQIIAGLCRACRQNRCALIGGETAEMPGLYPPHEYDLVGAIVGVVPRNRIVDGRSVRPGDVLIGLPSTGLHTNGFSLARKIVFEQQGLSVKDRFPGTRRTVGDVLLAVHRSYLKPVQALLRAVPVRGMAHITGGGFPDNLPRVLPKHVAAVVDRSSWAVPPLFRFLQDKGRVGRDEMYRVFNMGIGFVIIVRRADVEKALAVLRRRRAAPVVIGRIERGRGVVRLEG